MMESTEYVHVNPRKGRPTGTHTDEVHVFTVSSWESIYGLFDSPSVWLKRRVREWALAAVPDRLIINCITEPGPIMVEWIEDTMVVNVSGPFEVPAPDWRNSSLYSEAVRAAKIVHQNLMDLGEDRMPDGGACIEIVDIPSRNISYGHVHLGPINVLADVYPILVRNQGIFLQALRDVKNAQGQRLFGYVVENLDLVDGSRQPAQSTDPDPLPDPADFSATLLYDGAEGLGECTDTGTAQACYQWKRSHPDDVYTIKGGIKMYCPVAKTVTIVPDPTPVVLNDPNE